MTITGPKYPVAGPFFRLISRKVASSFVGRRFTWFTARARIDDLEFVARLLDEGEIAAVIENTYPLEKTADALRYLGEGHALGKLVIVPLAGRRRDSRGSCGKAGNPPLAAFWAAVSCPSSWRCSSAAWRLLPRPCRTPAWPVGWPPCDPAWAVTCSPGWRHRGPPRPLQWRRSSRSSRSSRSWPGRWRCASRPGPLAISPQRVIGRVVVVELSPVSEPSADGTPSKLSPFGGRGS